MTQIEAESNYFLRVLNRCVPCVPEKKQEKIIWPTKVSRALVDGKIIMSCDEHMWMGIWGPIMEMLADLQQMSSLIALRQTNLFLCGAVSVMAHTLEPRFNFKLDYLYDRFVQERAVKDFDVTAEIKFVENGKNGKEIEYNFTIYPESVSVVTDYNKQRGSLTHIPYDIDYDEMEEWCSNVMMEGSGQHVSTARALRFADSDDEDN